MAPVLIMEGKRFSPRLADLNGKSGRADHSTHTPEADLCYYCVERTPKETIWQNDSTSGRYNYALRGHHCCELASRVANMWLGGLTPLRSPGIVSRRIEYMFPLPLSDFEYYMLVDDRPSHPMVFVMAAQLTGTFRQAALQQALDELIQCHPFLNCRVAEIPGRGWCWTPLTTLATAATSDRKSTRLNSSHG